MEKVDFHIHTNASDGSWDSEEAVINIKKAGVKYCAISDHDSISNVKLAEYLAKQEGINLIRATEICSKSYDKEVHILGYDIDIDDIDLTYTMTRTKRVRQNRDTRIINWCAKRYDNVSLEEYNIYKMQEMAGLPIMNYLAEKNVCKGIEPFNAIKAQVPVPKEEDLLSSEEIIAAIKKAGGVAVLAHPSYYFPGNVMPKDMLENYLSMGIDGIECYSTYNPLKEQNEYYFDFCKKHDLIVSGGSDCHGSVYTTRFVGTPTVDLSQTNLLSRTRNYAKLQPNPCF
ncbi:MULTISPECIES: PHP domain-containing protein [Anaerofustis]|uniref:PHP domain-containing protein n=1 Tax=Anaerofustis TaxID=264995 RepID=UPI0011064CBB|nr:MULTISPECIES: PHP domain-containing protein [Anaerofustis]MCO8194678.1 PHP domain-containing protein [Anaerofustis sp. NSJ-163]